MVPVLRERDRLDVGVEVLTRRVGQRDVAELARVLLRGDGAAAGDPGVIRRGPANGARGGDAVRRLEPGLWPASVVALDDLRDGLAIAVLVLDDVGDPRLDAA